MRKMVFTIFIIETLVFLNCNVFASSMQVKAPVVSKPSGRYQDSIKIKFIQDNQASKIYYTLNNLTPSVKIKKTKLWDGKDIEIDSTVTLKAIAIQGNKKSKMSTYNYVITKSNGIDTNPQDIVKYLYLTENQDLEKLGMKYKKVTGEICNNGTEYCYYKDLKLGLISLTTSYNETYNVIIPDDDVTICGAKNGMTFKDVGEKLGQAYVNENIYRWPFEDYQENGYKIKYTFDDIYIIYFSENKDGSNGKFYLYRMLPKTISISKNDSKKLANGDTLDIKLFYGSFSGYEKLTIEQLDENYNKIKGLDKDITSEIVCIQAPELPYVPMGGGDRTFACKYKIKNINPSTKYIRVVVKECLVGEERTEYSNLYEVENMSKIAK